MECTRLSPHFLLTCEHPHSSQNGLRGPPAGPYDGVIGVKKELVVGKFLNGDAGAL